MGTTRGQEFTSSGTFNVPANVGSVMVTMSAGGGGGAPGRSTHVGGGGGGGAGEFCVRRSVKVTPLDAIAVTIGSGGTGGVFDAGDGGDGTDTSFGSIVMRHGYGGHAINAIPPGTFVGAGGGYAGGLGTSDDVPANKGARESATCFGGASGAGSPGAVSPPDMTGGACGPNAGGVFTDGVTKGGGGGAASMWGPGGNGGIGVNQNGSPPPAGSFGGGGGGSTGGSGSRIGGVGLSGYCLVEWMS